MKLRQTRWDFILQLSTAQKMFQNQHGYFSTVHLFLAWPCKMPSGWDGCWEHVFLFLSGKSRSQTEPRPGVPGQMCCQHAKDAEALLLLLSAPRWAAALHHPPQPNKRSWSVDSRHLPSIPCFHVCINKCSLRLYIPWKGRIFNNTLSINFYSSHTHPISLQHFQEQRAGPNHPFCIDLTQNAANQRKEHSPNFYSSIQVQLKLCLGSPPTSCWDLSRCEEGREGKQEEGAVSLRTP